MKVNLVSRCQSYFSTIHMAGALSEALPVIQQFVLKGACVQVAECEYVYTGGREKGFTARILAYPRFPKADASIFMEARQLGELLLDTLGQMSFSIETPRETVYFEREGAVKPGAPK